MPVKRLKRTHDLAAHSEWSQALGNLWHFPSRWTHLALGIRNPCFFFGCTGPRLLCMEASLSYSKQELLSVAVHGLLGARASIAAPQHVRSLWTRDWTRDPCTSRQILNHWPTREVPRNPEIHWLQLHLYGHTTYPCFWMPACMCRQRPHSPGLQGNNSPL